MSFILKLYKAKIIDNKDQYAADVRYLQTAPSSLWELITAYILPRTAVGLSLTDDLLGAVLSASPCQTRRQAYNDIGVALLKYRKCGKAPAPLQRFLESMSAIEQGHTHMIRTKPVESTSV